jgi:hypothetical protein
MNHAKEGGIVVYEQDWMKNQIESIPYLRKNYKAKERWLKNMAIAAKSNDIDIFYCMETPEMLLYSVKHNNINISRCSGDYNHRWPLTYRFIDLTQTNILFNSIGINSHPDVFRSRSIEEVKFRPFGEKHPKLRCLIQILGAGLVCPGDKKENVNWELLQKTCRNDGLLLKPDRALTANDLMFKPHRKYYISDTYTKKSNGLIWHYILITNIWPRRVKEGFITPKELGFSEEEFIFYDYKSEIMKRIQNESIINIGVLKKYDYKYYILCPIIDESIALIGCPDKFITCSNKQFPNISGTINKEGKFSFEVEDIANTRIKVLLYSEKKPKEIILESKFLEEKKVSDSWKYEKSIKKLEISLFFERKEKTEVNISY